MIRILFFALFSSMFISLKLGANELLPDNASFLMDNLLSSNTAQSKARLSLWTAGEGSMSREEVAKVIAHAGFPKKVVPIVTCLAQLESGFNPKAINNNRNHSHDYGLLQVNSIWLKKEACNTSVYHLLRADENARCALKIYKNQGLSAWTTYNENKELCENYSLPKKRIANRFVVKSPV